MIITIAIALGVAKGLLIPEPTATPTKSSDSTTVLEKQQQQQKHEATLTGQPNVPQELTAQPETTPAPLKKVKKDKGDKKDKGEKKDKGQSKDYQEEQIPFISVDDCHACPTPCQDQDHTHYPSYLKMDYESPLLGSSKPYSRHVLISTGMSDWEVSIDEDKESLAPYLQQAINDGQQRLKEANGGKDLPRIVLTNSSRKPEDWTGPGWQVIILPDHIVVNNVTPDQCDDFFEAFLTPPVGTLVGSFPFNPHKELAVEIDLGNRRQGEQASSVTSTKGSDWTTTVDATKTSSATTFTTTNTSTITTTTTTITTATASDSFETKSISTSGDSLSNGHHHHSHPPHYHAPDQTREVTAGKTTFLAHRWQPRGAVMICSHKKRDNRCGKTAPYLYKEFKQLLMARDIYGDGEGDFEIWNISHIGGHKFAGNIIVHRDDGLAVWYGRVEPCHCRAVVERTIEKGEVIKELYRGGMIGSFDPSRKKLAW